MTLSRTGLVGFALALCCFAARPSFATPITLDGTWVLRDQYIHEGEFFPDTWDWTSTEAVRLTVTDWLVATDRFNVYDNHAFHGSVSGGTDWQFIAGCNGHDHDASCHWTNDPNVALGDPMFASAQFLFAPGSHSISIQAYHIPTSSSTGTVYGDATVALQAEVVPEPSTLLLLGTGCVSIAAAWRRKRRHNV